MKKQLHFLAFAIAFIAFALTSKASHIMGGELTYKWISGNTYELTLSLYRDCYGIPAPTPTTDVVVHSSCFGSMSVMLNEIAVTNITPACDTVITCLNGLNGVEKHVYTGLVTLPGSCADFTFYWTLCCRNAAITNLTNAASYGATFYATLDNTQTPFNSSPIFANDPVIYLFTNQQYHINNGMFDSDGDSLVISMIEPLDGNTTTGPLNALPIPYNPPFNYLNPVTSASPLTIDSTTGEIVVEPLVSEVDVWAYRVDEYRNGVKIGSVTRDIQLVIFPGADQLPTLSGINQYPGSTTYVCAGDSLMFDILSADPDSGDSTFIAWHHFGQPNYTLTINPGQNEGASFMWATDSTMVNPNPYLLYVSVKDNACPYYGLQTYVYKIFVNQCITNDVWPGDANSDLVCNMYDILPVGLNYGSTGPVRSNASLNWVAQPAAPWTNTLASGINAKHADCDGNGIVDSLDLNAITLNYGSAHSKMGSSNTYVSGLPDLKISYSALQVAPGTPVEATIELGSQAIPVNAIYGIAYTLNYNVNMYQLGSAGLNTTTSFIGNSNNSISLTNGMVDNGNITCGMVRIDHNNATGFGQIAKFSFIANPLIMGDVTFNMSFSNVSLVMNDGAIVPVNVINNNPIIISQLLNTSGIENQIASMTIRPNQIKDVAIVSYNLTTASDVRLEVVDMLGNVVQSKHLGKVGAGLQQTSLNLLQLMQGAYFVRLTSSNGVATQRMIKL